MIQFYVDRIKRGLMQLEKVPLRWRDQVEKELKSDSKSDTIRAGGEICRLLK